MQSTAPSSRTRLGIAALFVLGVSSCSDGGSADGLDSRVYPTRSEHVASLQPWLDGELGAWPEPPELRLERITTAVPWPRGLVHAEGQLIVLARGRHRRAGGVDPDIEDFAGNLYRVDMEVSEPVVAGEPAGEAVAGNAQLLAAPTAPPFQLYDRSLGAPLRDTRMDRPYCTLRFDELSRNLFLCGFSGVDLPFARFRKNGGDSIHRFDLRTGEWNAVEAHNPNQLGEADLSYTVSNVHYPHHDPAANEAPHGWLNGADCLWVVGDYLYAGAKDNHRIVRYELAGIRADASTGPPKSVPVLGSHYRLRLGKEVHEIDLYGPSALVARDGWLYVGFRTSCAVIRLPLDERGALKPGEPGELLAVFEPWNGTQRVSADLMDMLFGPGGELYVVCSRKGRIWNLGVPDGSRVLDGRWASSAQPWLDLPKLSGTAKARTGNIAFDDQDRLYLCSGNYDASQPKEGYKAGLPGVIYRATKSSGQ